MIRSSLVTKLVLLVGGSLAVASLAVILLVTHQVRRIVEDSQNEVYNERLLAIERTLSRQAERLLLTGQSDVYAEDFKDSILSTLRRVYYTEEPQDDYPVIFERSGAVIMHPVLPRGDLSLAGRDGVGELLRTDRGQVDYTAPDGTRKRAVFRSFAPWDWSLAYTVPLESIYAPAREIQRTLLIVWIGVTLVVLVVLAVILVRFTQPILALAVTAEAMAAGDLDQTIDVRQGDEIGVLARAFAGMRDGIRQQMAALANANVQLRDSEDRYRQVFLTMTDALFILDRDGLVCAASPAAGRLLRCDPDSLIGLPLGRLFPRLDAAALARLASDAPDGPLSLAAFGKLRDGATVAVEVTAAPIVIGGRPHVLAIVRDVTERHELEAQLRQAQRLESIGRLAGGVAHDFNNLLSPIIGYSEMLLRESSPHAEWRTDVNQILLAASRAKELARQLLAFGRKQMLAMRVVDLAEIVRGFEPILRRTLRDDIELRVVDHGPTCAVRADATQVEQILMNLAINAQDAMPMGGGVTIATGSRLLAAADSRNHPGLAPGRYATLTVADTGVGVDVDVREHIFEPFFTTKGPGRGTGLGLATVHGIVTQHDGTIWVVSPPAGGAVFEIVLPAVAEPVPAPGSGSDVTVATDDRGHETIAVVEDNPMVRDLVAAVLGKQGYRVLTYADPRRCLADVVGAKVRMDLLLTDVVMPHLDGRELHERLAAAVPGLRVVYMSGYADEAILRRGLVADNGDFLQKPLSVAVLARKVREVLDREPRA